MLKNRDDQKNVRASMYGTLGYIDNGRRAPHRDPHFLGTNGHPSRKELSGAKRADEMFSSVSQTSTASTNALMERRCVFLEEQDRRRCAEIADLRAKLSELRHGIESIQGTVVVDTVETANIDNRKELGNVPAGQELRLFYPMKKIDAMDGGYEVWMSRRFVCPDLASVTYTWVRIFKEGKDGDQIYVTDFR